MNKKKKEKIENNKYKKILLEELRFLSITFLIFYVFFQIHYYKQSIFMVSRLVMGHYFLFIIPGYSLCIFLRNKINKIERFIIALGLGYGGQSVILYNLNLLIKKNILNYNKILSFILFIIGLILFYLNEKANKNKTDK